MKRLTVFLLVIGAVTLHAEKISLIGATVINPADGKILPNATIVIDGDKIERVSMGKQDAATLGKQIDCTGKFILPGYIDTHVHFFQSADLFTRPDRPSPFASNFKANETNRDCVRHSLDGSEHFRR